MEIRTINHVYYSANPSGDIEYKDWTMLLTNWYYRRGDEDILVNDNVCQRITDAGNKSTIVPTGSSIYVAPRSKFSSADIRKNYTIKRAPDTGDYNVLTESVMEVSPCYHIETLIALPGRCLFLASEKCLNNEAAQINFCKDMLYNYGGFDPSEPFFVQYKIKLSRIQGSDLAFRFLNNMFEKPVIMESALDLSTGNAVTLDILDILYNAGKQEYSDEARQNYLTVLNMLNQHNWRDCPGTIGMIFGRQKTFAVHRYMSRKPSQWPKPVQEILSTCMRADYKDEKDKQLSQDYINRLLNIGQQRFATQDDMDKQLSAYDISYGVFLELFDCVVRIRPKTFTE